jgi:hypothetical protein
MPRRAFRPRVSVVDGGPPSAVVAGTDEKGPFFVVTARRAASFLLLLGAVHCRAPGAGESSAKGADGGIAASSSASSAAPVSSAAPLDRAGTLYPRDVPPHPRAARLCQALHGIAARRKAECCGGESSSFLESTCARVVAASLHAKTVEFDDAAVDACAVAMDAAASGCAWVTPSAAPAPEACQGLLQGTLAQGSACRSSLECRGNLHCEGASVARTGVCTAPSAEGAACGTHVDVLATYTLERALATTHPFCADFCSLTAHRCQSAPKIGAPCLSGVGCAPSQTCVAGRCSAAPAAARGESCAAAPCAADLRCVDRKCVARSGSDETCSSDLDCAKGGCVPGADGHGACGSKCNATLDVLTGAASGAPMRLTAAPPSGGKR